MNQQEIAQSTACLDNLRAVLHVHGFDVVDVRRLTVCVVGGQALLRDAWRAVGAWFDGDVPPVTLLGVGALGYDDQLVEVDATVSRVPPT